MATGNQIIQADLTYLDGEFRPEMQVVVGEDGGIERVEASSETPTLMLERQALLPGMVNAHSHAFQRALRGQGERFPEGRGSFWTWRQAMYAQVETMTPAEMHRWCRQAFTEMLHAGITSVGEFHYLRHGPAGDRYAFDEVVLDAAREVGIRITLLLAYYKTGGIGQPLAGAQERFATPTLAEFWKQFDSLADRLDPRTQSLGVAPHSIRAVPIDDLTALVAEARRRGVVIHMHLEEQPQEIADCKAAYGLSPIELCLERALLDHRFTAVHATHCPSPVLDRLISTGANLCVCPLTEANLGDGVPDLAAAWSRGPSICLGTDSNARIDLIEEQRWLEYAQRLTRRSRGVLRHSGGELAAALFRCATENGAKALGLDAGAIRAGCPADFFTLDLDHAALAGWAPATLLESVIFGCGGEVVRRVCVGGRWVK